MKIPNSFCIVALVFLLIGCASPFTRFYREVTTAPKDSLVYSNEDPQIFKGSDQEQDFMKMFEDGYVLIGVSSFNAGNVNWNGAIVQARKIHASVVVAYSKYTNTVSGAIPLTTPDVTTSTTSSSGSVYGSRGGYGTYSGSSQTTSYGTSTTYIPYNVDNYDCFAAYYVKSKPPRLGVLYDDLPVELRQAMGTNKGALVRAVRKGSPAYDSDIIAGDVIRKVSDDVITDKHSLMSAINRYQGQAVPVTIWRNGNDLVKEVQLNR